MFAAGSDGLLCPCPVIREDPVVAITWVATQIRHSKCVLLLPVLFHTCMYVTGNA